MAKGYVALIDVLGFSNIVMGKGEEGVKAYLTRLQGMQQASDVDYIAFSDTIVLTREGEQDSDLALVVRACSRLFIELLRQDTAVRGAIAYGDFVRQVVKGSVFGAGRAVIEAYRFEQAQDWVGIMLAPSARERVPQLATWCNLDIPHMPGRLDEIYKNIGWSAHLFRWSRIPFHAKDAFDDNDYDGYAVLPTAGNTPAMVRDDLQAAVERLDWLRQLAPDPRDQRKHQKAIQFLRQAWGSWHNIARHEGQIRAQDKAQG